MRKTFLMLLLCAPLVWAACREGQRLYEVSKWSSPSVATATLEPRPETGELARIKLSADAIIELPATVAAAIVRLDSPPQDQVVTGEFARALLKHAQARAVARNRVERARFEEAEIARCIKETLERIRSNAAGPDNHREREANLKHLDELLKKYGELDVFDPQMLASARAESALVPR